MELCLDNSCAASRGQFRTEDAELLGFGGFSDVKLIRKLPDEW